MGPPPKPAETLSPDTVKGKMSQLMRLWLFSSSVNSFFNRTCTAIQWGLMSDVWSDPSSTSLVHVCEQQRLWWDCAGLPEPSLVACVISSIIPWAGLNNLSHVTRKPVVGSHVTRKPVVGVGKHISCFIAMEASKMFYIAGVDIKLSRQRLTKVLIRLCLVLSYLHMANQILTGMGSFLNHWNENSFQKCTYQRFLTVLYKLGETLFGWLQFFQW